MSEVSKREFAGAVAAAISSVHHLYREVGKLYSVIRDGLQSEPDAFVALGGFQARPSRDADRTLVRNFYGQLFEPGLSESDDLEDGDEGDDDDEGDQETRTGRRKPPALIDPGKPLLIVKLQLYDPRQGTDFEPQVQFGAAGDWGLGPANKKPRESESFELAWYMLRRIVKAFDPASIQVDGQRLVSRAMVKGRRGEKSIDRQLSFRILAPVERVPIYDLESSDSLDGLVSRIKEYWTRSTALDVQTA